MNGSFRHCSRGVACFYSGSALLIALPDIMTQLHAGFMTIMWVIPGFMLIATALVPVVGRLADMFGRKNLNSAGFAVFTLGPVIGGILTAIDCRLVFLINVPLSVTGLTPFQTAIN